MATIWADDRYAKCGKLVVGKGIKFRRFEMFESCTVAEEDAKFLEAYNSALDGVEVSEEDDT